MSAAVILQYRNSKRKRHHESYLENEKGGCARADSEGTRRSPKLGGGFLPPPKQPPALAPTPQSGRARISRNPRHLGASSPSGNVRGECRGLTPLDHGTQNDRMVEAQYRNWFCIFLSAPNFSKTKRGANGKFLPKPQYERIYWVFVFNLRSDFSQKQ